MISIGAAICKRFWASELMSEWQYEPHLSIAQFVKGSKQFPYSQPHLKVELTIQEG